MLFDADVVTRRKKCVSDSESSRALRNSGAQGATERKQDMQRNRGFTIIELLVVVSIIALLVGILLPAIGKARDQAQLTRSQANMKQLGTALATYGAEYGDRQPTWITDNFSTYGNNAVAAFAGYQTSVGIAHPWAILGYGQGVIWVWALAENTYLPFNPASTTNKFGSFRLPNNRSVSTYLNGRFYDPVYYAPKDKAVMGSVERWFDHPDEYVSSGVTGGQKFSSYCFSPAAMVSPDVLGLNRTTDLYYTDPWTIGAGWRSPSFSQAQFPDLKTHMIEHHWLQNNKKTCNPFFASGPYDGCQPYFFNGSIESAPVCLFYDGHIAAAGQRDAIEANKRVATQNGRPNDGGLWSVNTVWAGQYADYGTGGYYTQAALDWTSTSYHILTIDGIKGRDFLGK
jgi:prepilin-type N-terminal cleavage/methylation domain-containing protein